MQVFGSVFRGVVLELRKAPSGARSLRSLLRSGWSMASGPLELPLDPAAQHHRAKGATFGGWSDVRRDGAGLALLSPLRPFAD